jgi:hypothetical protein
VKSSSAPGSRSGRNFSSETLFQLHKQSSRTKAVSMPNQGIIIGLWTSKN